MRIPPLRFVAVVSIVAAPWLHGATFTVQNLNDAGSGSLRDAMHQANQSNGNSIAFDVSGTITLASPLPDITKTVTIDGTTAPGYVDSPVVAVDFSGRSGLVFGTSSTGSSLRGLSLAGAGTSAVTLAGSQITISQNYIGLLPDGTVLPNFGDGITIQSTSTGNLIGSFDPVASIDYFDATDPAEFPVQPVSGWQGIRDYAPEPGSFMICGTSGEDGILYIGPVAGGGDAYTMVFPGADTISTSSYGPANLENGNIRMVGAYRTSSSTQFNLGFVWEGTADQLPSGGTWQTISYPNATYQFTHSTMGDLAVGNADAPAANGAPLGAGTAYIYHIPSQTFLTTIVFPGSKSNTAYGIWQNSPTSYTICGGYSPLVTNNLPTPDRPLQQGKAFLVDYDTSTGKFSNWKSFEYPNGPAGVNLDTHFQGISSVEPGVYTLSADSLAAGAPAPVQGSWVSVRRNSDGTFSEGTWVDLAYPGVDGITSADSVYGFNIVGFVSGEDTDFSYQATVNTAFQLSNVISGNARDGIRVTGSRDNVIAMNYIGTTPDGTGGSDYGNAGNGIFLTGGTRNNLIGGPAFGVNNPTGSKNPANAVFQRPPQGNLISGNLSNGVLINDGSQNNTLSGNFIGTDADGTAANGNGMDGVRIQNAPRNALIGCTFYENPFVYYNVVSGNRGHGVRVDSSNDVTIQANFFGMGADNATSVPNGGDGLLVSGTSRNTQVGGVIPLGNVISGNTLHGIEVRDQVSGFISFNTFGGIAAFQEFASPNGLNGIHITATGGNNVVRTCIISGNKWHGIEISGNATGVEITDTAVGTNTVINSAIPNEGSGIVISGNARNNAIGGFQPSVEMTVHASGNKGYGIAIVENARNNRIYGAQVGVGAGPNGGSIPNEFGGILLDEGTSGTILGGSSAALANTIQSNDDAGLFINNSTSNDVVGNSITLNSVVGLYAVGNCSNTYVWNNTITDNGAGGTNNIDVSNATGIIFGPRPAPPAPPAPPTPLTPEQQQIIALEEEVVVLQDLVIQISATVPNRIVRDRQIKRIRAQIRRLRQQITALST